MSVTNGATSPGLPQATTPEEWVIEREDRDTNALVLYIEAGMKDTKKKQSDLNADPTFSYLEFGIVGVYDPNVVRRAATHYRDAGWQAVTMVAAQGSPNTIVTMVFP